MAADCQMTDGFIPMRYERKIRKIQGHLIGGAGVVDDLELFFKWYEEFLSNKPKLQAPRLGKSFEGLAVSPEGVLHNYSHRLIATQIDEPFYAIGSGGPVALGALEKGATVVEAVKIAIKRDIYSGLGVVTIERDIERGAVSKGAGLRSPARGGIRQRPKRSGGRDEVRDKQESPPKGRHKKSN